MVAVKPSPLGNRLGGCTKRWWGRACLDGTGLVAGAATFLVVFGVLVSTCAAAAAWKCLSVTRQAGKVGAYLTISNMLDLS